MKTLEEKSLVYRTVKERYLWEHDRKNELNNIISIPLGLMSVLIGCLAYFFNNQPKNSNTLLFILYYAFITISILCLIFCLYCFYFHQTGYTYCYISSPDKLFEYEQSYIKNFNDNKVEVDYNIINDRVSMFLYEQYANAATQNKTNNERKIKFYRYLIMSITVCIIFLGATFYCRVNLENQEICNNIIALRKEKLFFSFNSVFHRLSPLVKDIHEYFMKKEDKLKVGLGVSPRLVRYIGTASEPFLFRKEDYHYLNENAEYIVNYIFKALLDNNPIAIDKNLGEPIKELFVRIINKLGNNPLPFIKNQPSCGTLFATKVAISGERVFCNGVTEGGDLTKAKNLLTNYKSWDKCDTCETNTLCQGICAALTEAQLEKNCNTFKYFYNKVEELIKKVYYNS